MSYFADVQGTLIDDINKQPLPGAIDFIDTLNAKNIPYLVVTNNTKMHSVEFLGYLQGLGFCIDAEHYLDPLSVLKKILTCKELSCFGPQEFIDVIEQMGYVNTYKNPEAVLITSSKDFSAQDFAQMIELVQRGAKLIGMHATSIYAKEGRPYPGVGAILQMIHYASGKEYEIIGKPSHKFYDMALRQLSSQADGITTENLTMVSDDAVGDLCGIKQMGAKTVLVLSGKCKSEDQVLHVRENIDDIVQDIGALEGV